MEINNLNGQYLKPADFTAIGVVANTCNKQKLNISIGEALEFDIIPIFCYPFVSAMLGKWPLSELSKEEAAELPISDQMYRLALIGGEYINSSGVKSYFAGFKKVWSYYSYAKYVVTNAVDDTPQGLVTKTNSFGMPVDVNGFNAIAVRYKNMGKEAYQNTLIFLCQGKTFYPEFDSCNCVLACGCTAVCSCNGKPKRITGFKAKTLEK